LLPTSTPAKTSTPTPTATPRGIVIYDFSTNACSAIWISGAGVQPCPGTIGNIQGFVYYLDSPQLEDGTRGQHGLLTAPDHSSNGIMLGIFPPLAIQSGDHFQTHLSCKYQTSQCEIVFQLDYQIENGPIKSLARVTERSNGNSSYLDIDLSTLAGNKVKLLFTLIANGMSNVNWGLWVDPVIIHYTSLVQSISSGPGTISDSPIRGPIPSPSPDSCNRAAFVKDLTIPDGTTLKPGQSFTKIWRLKNIGTCTWITTYRVLFIGRDSLGASGSVNLPSSVFPGQTVDMGVNMIAPIASGHYIGYWKLQDPQGGIFGVGPAYNSPFWVDINVASP
jgi:hypothetical protein